MAPLKNSLGRIYTFKSVEECNELGIASDIITEDARRHMVLVVNLEPAKTKRGYVRVMAITSKVTDDGEYLPIRPTPKKGYDIQLRLRNEWEWQYGGAKMSRHSYLRIDSYMEVPIQMLNAAKDRGGEPLMIFPKHQGGLKELQDYLRRREQKRLRKKEDQEPCQMNANENQSWGDRWLQFIAGWRVESKTEKS